MDMLCALVIAGGLIIGGLFVSSGLIEIAKQMKSLWLAVARISAKPPEGKE